MIKLISDIKIAKRLDDEDGNLYKVAYFNGYNFGDKVLEGVYFEVRCLEDGRIEVSPVDEWSEDPYLSWLSEKTWMKRALEFAEENDMFTDKPGIGGEKDLCFVPLGSTQ